jgi:type IV fimbrial biogenesis protein FimT
VLAIRGIARNRAWTLISMRGFSLIELMIGLAILAMLLMMGVPAFGTYIQNAKLRSTAENFYAGLQSARAEAVKRNAPVEFILTDDSGESANTQTDNLSTTGKNWIVRVQDPTTLIYTFVEGKPAAEGSGTSGTSSVDINGTVSAVTFNGFGATTLGSSATFAITNPAGGLCRAAGGPMRCLSIVVSIGGQARLCDPAVTTVGDTRRC